MSNLQSNFILYGKHARYANYLSKEQRKERVDGINIFERVMDLVMIAAIVGKIHNLMEENDNDKHKSTIQLDTLLREADYLDYIIDLISLTSNSKEEDEKLDITFRSSIDNEKRTFKVELFKKYVNGGISYIYDYFNVPGIENKEEKIKRMITFYAEEF